MLTQALELAIVAWLPGAMIFRAPVADRAKRASLAPEERLFWAVVISIALSLAAVLALSFLGRYTFPRLLAANVALSAGVALASRFDLRLGAARRWPSLSMLLPLALVALGLWKFFPPAEVVIGGKDPGIYISEGIQIAQRGTFRYEDPVVTSTPAFARDLFFRRDDRPGYYGLRFMGFPLLDIESGTVVGQFPHLFPASIAIGYGIDGLTGARRTTGAWAILGLLAVYFVGARLFGPVAGFAGAALLGLHLVQVWFARYPNAEVVMQALGFAAFLSSARAHVDDDGFFAPLGGFLLGLLLFLRVDAALALVGVLAGIGLLVITGGRVRIGFLASLAATALAATAYLLGPMAPYTERSVLTLQAMTWWLTWWHYTVIVTAVIVGIAAIALARRSAAVRSRTRLLAPRILAAALVAGAVYALYFREPGGRLAPHDAYALKTFTAYYLYLPAVVAALLGYALATRRTFWRAPEFFATAALYCLFFFHKIYIVPEHFWMARRLLPVILPAMLLCAAAAALGTRGGATAVRPLRWAIGALFLALLGGQYVAASRPILEHVEYAGIVPRLERLASAVGDGDLLIVESRDAGTDVHTLAIPLAYIYGRSVVVFTSAAPDKDAFADFLQWAESKYSRVLFLGAGGTDLLSPAWGARVLTADRFRVPEYIAGPGEFPRRPRAKQFDYTVYELTPPADYETAGDVGVDLGTEDDLNVLRFHAKEETEGRSFRWSQDVSYVILRDLDAGHRLVTLWMSDGGRPDAAPPADVTVHLDDEPVGTVRVEGGFKPYGFDLPAPLAARAAGKKAPVRLKLTTSVWSPEQVLGTPDDRELGVMVDRVAVK